MIVNARELVLNRAGTNQACAKRVRRSGTEGDGHAGSSRGGLHTDLAVGLSTRACRRSGRSGGARRNRIGARCDDVKRLVGNNLATAVQVQTQTDAPTKIDQVTVVAKRRRRQDARQRLFVGKAEATKLAFGDPLKEMDVKILVALAFGVPHHGQLDRLNLVDRNSPNPPSGRQLSTGLIHTVFATE